MVILKTGLNLKKEDIERMSMLPIEQKKSLLINMMKVSKNKEAVLSFIEKCGLSVEILLAIACNSNYREEKWKMSMTKIFRLVQEMLSS